MAVLLTFATVFGSIFVAVNGLAFPGPEPTSVIQDDEGLLLGWTPKPTAAPHHALFARQQQYYDYDYYSTCGFVDAEYSEALVCTSGWGCAYWTASANNPQFYGCCPILASTIQFSDTRCSHAEACVDYGLATTYSGTTINNNGTNAEATIYDYIKYCGTASRYCARTLLTSQGAQFTHFACDTISDQITMAYDTYIGEVFGGSSSSIVTTPSTVPITTPTTNSSPTTMPTTGPVTTPTPTPTPTPAPGPKSSNTGAIAGGAVGGIAGAALIAAVIGWLVYRKRKQRKEAVPEVSQYTVYANNK